MKHIGIVGSFGSGNLGDEAAWISIKQFLYNKKPQYKYHTHIFHWSHPFQDCGFHCTPFYLLTDKEIEWINNNFEAIIITGGGIIGSKWGFTKTSGIKRVLENLKIPIYVISISAEKDNYSIDNIEIVRYLIKKSKIFTVRNKISQNVVKGLLYSNSLYTPEITPDIVTIMETGLKQFVEASKFTDKIIMTNASNCLQNYLVDFWKVVYKSLGGSEKIDIVPFAHSSNDINLVQLVKQGLDYKLYTPEEMQQIIASSKFVIAGRLHAAVFAANVGIPFFAINYHPKIAQFCEQIGYPYYWPKTPMKKDSTGYGYDYATLDPNELIMEIKKAIDNPIKPIINNTAKDIMEYVWNDMNKPIIKEVPCMYCGWKLFIPLKDMPETIKCENCNNINTTNDVRKN